MQRICVESVFSWALRGLTVSILVWGVPNCSAAEELALEYVLGSGQKLELRLEPAPVFVLSGGTAQQNTSAGEDFFRVYVQGSGADNESPPILGKYEFTQEGLLFSPRFPLSPKVVYRVKLADDLGGAKSDYQFQLPSSRHKSATKVLAVYPSDSALPENLLKFYVYFSHPMSRGEAYSRIHLLRNGEPVVDPFLELGEELWNSDQTRFTLFIHPGRIKRGVKPREDQGPSLQAGNHYQLQIDAAWVDSQGDPLAESFVKEFEATGPNYDQLNPATWKIETPDALTKTPVRLIFDRPLDRAMLDRVLKVLALDGSEVAGSISVDDNETRWSFTPDDPWPINTYNIQVATNLEDRSGNNIVRPFEVQMRNQNSEKPVPIIAIEFVVK
ncbi:MAG: hypothetical protein KDB03_18610 [Planctomycetales bacterium]|nr:hypothetical protein [Planctomycetales bacterium]